MPLLQLPENPQGDSTVDQLTQMIKGEGFQLRANLGQADKAPGDDEPIEPVGYDFGLSRRGFVQFLTAGLVVAGASPALAQRNGRRGGFGGNGAKNIGARIHLGKDGSITVLVGKVEAGQGARAELTQAAAEELRVPASRVQLVMADTDLVPNDGITAGSGSSPRLR